MNQLENRNNFKSKRKDNTIMWNTPSKERLGKIPRLYETESIPLKDKLIHLHFFIAGCDWYIAEFDGDDLFWGFAILNNDYLNAEWGFISFSELKAIKISGWLEIDCELEELWRIRKSSEIENIRKAQDWPKEISKQPKIDNEKKLSQEAQSWN
jgi:hypothetical protein